MFSKILPMTDETTEDRREADDIRGPDLGVAPSRSY